MNFVHHHMHMKVLAIFVGNRNELMFVVFELLQGIAHAVQPLLSGWLLVVRPG
jgi:hypothetical protein